MTRKELILFDYAKDLYNQEKQMIEMFNDSKTDHSKLTRMMIHGKYHTALHLLEAISFAFSDSTTEEQLKSYLENHKKFR